MSKTATLTKKPTLDATMALVRADLESVNALILRRVAEEIPMIREVARHIIASGGKRLRPVLTLLAAQACGYQGTRHIGLAASVELIHTATLLHDDVVDESALRRGLATANDVFGNKTSVLVGDFLLAQAFQLMVADGSLQSLKILSDAAAIISRGEVKQLMTEGAPETTEAQYLDVIESKTAALFAAACELGAVVSGKQEWEAPLRAYGMHIGTAFQLVDDALDYSGEESALGKTVGDDFREGKITLPVILAYQAANAEEKAFWLRTMEAREQREGDLQQAMALMHKTQSISKSFAAARRFAGLAAEALAPLPASSAKSALLEVVDFCIDRVY